MGFSLSSLNPLRLVNNPLVNPVGVGTQAVTGITPAQQLAAGAAIGGGAYLAGAGGAAVPGSAAAMTPEAYAAGTAAGYGTTGAVAGAGGAAATPSWASTLTPGQVALGGAVAAPLLNALTAPDAPGPNTTTSSQTYGPGEQAARDLQMQEALRVYQEAVERERLAGNPNPEVAPQSPDTIAAQNTLRTYATGAGQTGVNEMLTGMNYGLTGAMDVRNNPYLAEAIQAAIRPTVQAFTDTGGVLSNIRGDTLQAGQYGGTRQGLAEGVAAGRLAQSTLDTGAKMGSQAYETGQNTFARTLALAPSLIQAGQMPSQMQSAIGTQNEAYQQEVLNQQAQGKAWDLNKGWAPLQQFTNITNALSSPTTTTTAPPTPAPRRNYLGDAIAGATLANLVWGGGSTTQQKG